MNGIMLGHWGCITWPDDDLWQNVVLTEGGRFEKFDESKPFVLTGGRVDILPSEDGMSDQNPSHSSSALG